MKRKLSLCACVAVAMWWNSAAAAYQTLIVHLSDGSDVNVSLADDFKTTFTSDAMLISSAGTDVDVPRDNIVSFKFDKTGGITSAEGGDAVEFSDGKIVFRALPDGSSVRVYSVNGTLVMSENVSGEWTLSLSDLPSGVNIVAVNGVSYKVNVK